MKIGIMQGRLVPPQGARFQSFPVNGWEKEFAHAQQAGLDTIEWIYDEFGLGVNPIETETGINTIKELSRETGVAIRSMCADYFMEQPLVRATPQQLEERLQRLRWLLDQSSRIGIQRIVLPFVDNSKITNEKEQEEVVRALGLIAPEAARRSIELHLETSLDPQLFRGLIGRINHPFVKINYDSGNSSSLGYNPTEEFAAYGGSIGSIHIKDRVKGGSTVPLGTGSADFPALFSAIKQAKYRGDFILQVARGKEGGEVAWTAGNVKFLKARLEEFGIS